MQDEWTREVRRILTTKGSGLCKRTQWVPISDYYSYRTAAGTTRTRVWRVRADLGALATPRGGTIVADDILPGRYAGFRELRPGEPRWRFRPVRDGGAPVVVPEDGLNGVWQWQAGDSWTFLDPAIARDLRELHERRAQQHRERMQQADEEIAAIRNRFADHLATHQANTTGPIASEELDILRSEATSHAETRTRIEGENRQAGIRRERERREDVWWETVREHGGRGPCWRRLRT